MMLNFIYGSFVLLLATNTFSNAETTKVIDLNEENWRSVLENEWMIEL